MKSTASALLALACASALGCYPPPGAPSLILQQGSPFFVDFDERVDTVHLTWTHPTGDAGGGYAVEMRIVPGDFAVVATTSPRTLEYLHVFDTEPPDATDFEFRVRALPDEEGTRASAPVAYHRAVGASSPGRDVSAASGLKRVGP
jgi:hypothetical protein